MYLRKLVYDDPPSIAAYYDSMLLNLNHPNTSPEAFMALAHIFCTYLAGVHYPQLSLSLSLTQAGGISKPLIDSRLPLTQAPVIADGIKNAIINSFKTKFYMMPKPFSDCARECLELVESESRFPGYSLVQQFLNEFPLLLSTSMSSSSSSSSSSATTPPATPPHLSNSMSGGNSASSANLPKVGRERLVHLLIDSSCTGATELQSLLATSNRGAEPNIRTLQTLILTRTPSIICQVQPRRHIDCIW